MFIGSHNNILVNFILLSVCSGLVVAPYSLVENTIGAVRTESSLPDLFPRKGELLEKINPVKDESKSLNENLISIFRQSFFTKNSESHFIDLEHLDHQKRLEIGQSWFQNRDQVISLDEDLLELKAINLAVKERCSWLKPLMKGSNIPNLSEAARHLNKIFGKLGVLKKARYLELAKIDQRNLNAKFFAWIVSQKTKKLGKKARVTGSELPEEIIEGINGRAWKIFGNSIVLELKQLIHSHRLFLDDSQSQEQPEELITELQMWWEGALKTLDFLFKYGFADQDTIKSFFQGPERIKQLIRYTEQCFISKFNESPFLVGSPHLTRHWYWLRVHECFKALSEKEENLINAYFLLHFRHDEMLALKHEHLPPYPAPWQFFFESFESVQHSLFLGAMENPRAYHKLQRALQLQIEAQKEAKKIISLLGNPIQEPLNDIEPEIPSAVLEGYLYHVLDFIEKYISRDIINSVAPENSNFNRFENKINLIRINDKLHDLAWDADAFYKFLQQQSPSDWFASSSYKSEFNSFFIEAKKTFDQFEKEVQRLDQKKLQEPINTEVYNQILEIRQVIENMKNDLKTKYNTFKPNLHY